MKKILVAMFLAAATSAQASPYAPQEFDFSELLGTVESVHEVPLKNPLADAFEHALNPQTVDQLTVRLDDGGAVILQNQEMQRFAPGQRVRVVPYNDGPH